MRPEPETTTSSKTEELVDHVKEYINTHVEIIKLKAIDKAAGGIAVVSLVAILVFLFACIFILANIGLAIVISHLMGDGFSGFFIVAGFYVAVGIFLYISRDALVKKVIAAKIIRCMWTDSSHLH